MSQSTLGTDLRVTGTLTAGTLVPSAGCVLNAHVGTGTSGAYIASTKIQQQYSKTIWLANHATAAATVRYTAHRVYGVTGTIVYIGFSATVVPTGADSVTCTLKKNGSAILTASVVLDIGNTVYVAEAGTLSSSSVVAGDLLEVEITAVSGTTGKGVAAHLVLTEDPA